MTSVGEDVAGPADAAMDPRGPRKDDDNIESEEKERRPRQPTYVARVALPATRVEPENGFASLELGTAVTAEIWTHERMAISSLMSPLIRLGPEGLRKR